MVARLQQFYFAAATFHLLILPCALIQNPEKPGFSGVPELAFRLLYVFFKNATSKNVTRRRKHPMSKTTIRTPLAFGMQTQERRTEIILIASGLLFVSWFLFDFYQAVENPTLIGM